MVSRMSNAVKAMRSILLVATLSIPSFLNAQPAPDAWRWTFNGNLFAGINYQHRKFDDFKTFESQNWAMALGEKPLGEGRLMVHSMVSLEPFTLKKIGSPQVFQTGETFRDARLIDYQHPHDLF